MIVFLIMLAMIIVPATILFLFIAGLEEDEPDNLPNMKLILDVKSTSPQDVQVTIDALTRAIDGTPAVIDPQIFIGLRGCLERAKTEMEEAKIHD